MTFKQTLENLFTSTPKGLTRTEWQHFQQMIDASAQSKMDASDLAFQPNTNESRELTKKSAVNLEQYGLQGPFALSEFLLTASGKVLLTKIATEIALEKKILETQLQLQKEIFQKDEARTLLFHWLLDEDEEEIKKSQYQLIELQHQQNKKEISKQQPTNTEPNQAFNDLLHAYDNAIVEHLQKENSLENEIEHLSHRLDILKLESELIKIKYETYHQFDQEAANYLKDHVKREQRITALELLIQAATEDVLRTFDEGHEEEARALLNTQNTLNLELANLRDISAVHAKTKKFVDEHGNDKDINAEDFSLEHNVFILPLTLKIHKDLEGTHYLLNLNEQFVNLSTEQKQEAQKRFEHAAPDIKVVRKVLQQVEHQTKELNKTEIAKVDAKKTVKKAELSMVKNQIATLQTAKLNAEKAKKNMFSSLKMRTPESTITDATLNKITLPKLRPRLITGSFFLQTLLAEKVQQKKNYKPTWSDLFTFVKDIPDEEVQEKAEKWLDKAYKEFLQKEFLKKNPKFSDIIKNTPIPEVAMSNFLKYMAQFEFAYKIGPEKSPLEQRLEPQPQPEPPTPSASI